MKTSRLAPGANPCGATHPCASASTRPAQSERSLIHLAAFLLLALIGEKAAAASANLAWDPNPEADIAGYKLSYGTSSGTYSNTLPTGTATSSTVSGLTEGQIYYFVVKAVNTAGLESAPSAEVVYQVPEIGTSPGSPISRAGWTLENVSSEEPPLYAAALAFDGNPNTFWHTEWINRTSPPPHEIAIDLGVIQSIAGFRYLPRQDSYEDGTIAQYEFYVSMDGINWGSPVASGIFANSKTEKEVLFNSLSGRYVKLREITEVNGKTHCNIAELNIVQGETVDEPSSPANQVPVAASQTTSTAEDSAVAITLFGSDADGDQLGFIIASGPTMGSLSGTAPNLTYTPATDANGTDSFTFRVNDGKADSNTATVSITVAEINDVPMAFAQVTSTPEDKMLGILLSASDKDGDALSYRIVSSPSKGSLSGAAPNLTYTPNPNASGSDSFSFLANDGKADSNSATVSITISPVNDVPVAVAQLIAATVGTPVGIVLSASDADGDPLTFSIVGGPLQGSLSGSPPNLSYTPNANASGSDSFSFRASDGKANSNTATVSISITAAEQPDNKAPVFQADLITRADGKTNETYAAESLAGSAVDPDGDVVSYSKVAGPEWLTISTDGEISGTPPAAAEGSNVFTIRASDPKGTFDETMLEITIQPGAQLPLPWSLGRIGTVSLDATAWGEATALRIKSSGSMAGSTDSGIFTWQTLSGDGKIIARISSLENVDGTSRIGLAIRESLAANAKHVFIGTDGGGTLRFIRRTKTGGSASSSNAGSGSMPNLWLRLARNGDTITASSSTDGTNWNRIGKINLSLAESTYVGLMVSGGGNNLGTGVFQDMSVIP